MDVFIDSDLVETIIYSEEEQFYRDTILPGFGIVSTYNTQDYYVERRSGCRLFREYLCPIDRMEPEEAREIALRRLYSLNTDEKPCYLYKD